MKIAVFSDVHANVQALESVIRDFDKQQVDQIVFLGDLIMTGPRPLEVYQMLEELKPHVWIKGNNDDWLSELNDLSPSNSKEEKLREIALWASDKFTEDQRQNIISKEISVDKIYKDFKITFCHGTPKSYSGRLLPDSDTQFLIDEFSDIHSDIVVCGHTHLRFTLYHTSGVIKNFGSVSIPVSDHSKYARYGIIHLNENIGFEDRDCEYDFNGFLKDMRDLKYPGESMILPKYGIS